MLEEYFICPITQSSIKDAVVASDGVVYERAAIEEWINRCRSSGQVRSPSTNLPLVSLNLYPLPALNQLLASEAKQQENVSHRESLTGIEDLLIQASLKSALQENKILLERLSELTQRLSRNEAELVKMKREYLEIEVERDRLKHEGEESHQKRMMENRVSPSNSSGSSQVPVFFVDMREDGFSLAKVNELLQANPFLRSIRLNVYGVSETIPAHHEWVTALAGLPDNTFLSGARSSIDPKKRDPRTAGDIKRWCFDNGGRCLQLFRGHTGQVWRIALAPDGTGFASASEDTTVRIWSLSAAEGVSSSENVIESSEVYREHSAGVVALTYLSSAKLASGSRDQRICIWDLTGSGRVQMLVGHQSTVYGLVGLEGNRLASSAEDGCLRIWNLDDLSCTQELNDHQKLTHALTITPDHRYLVSGSDDCTIRLWEIANGFISTVLVGHTDFVNTFAFLNKDTLLSGSDDKTIKVWDLRTRRCVQTLPINTNWIWSLTTLLNGEILSGDTKGFITHWKKVTKYLSFRSYLKEKCHISVSENIIYLKQSSEDQFNSEASFLFSEAKNFIAFIVSQDEGLRNISVHSLGRDIVSYTCSMVDQTKLLLELFYALQNVNVEAFQKSQISYSTNRYMLSSIRDRNTAGQGENGRSEFYGSRPQASSSSSY